MKTIKNLSQLLMLMFITFSLSSCLEDKCEATRTFIEYEAIYVQPDEFRVNNFDYFESRLLENPGKIYYYNDILFVNERYEGVHMYENSDPYNPSYLGFISIPGNLDVSIRNDIMYADNYVDLVTIDVSDIENPTLLTRTEQVFNIYDFWDKLGYFVYTKETERTIEISCDNQNFNQPWFWQNGNVFADVNAESFDVGVNNIGSNANTNTVGQGGSFARFSVINDNLYVLNESELKTFGIDDPSTPEELSALHVDWGRIETLFPYGDHLFIGGTAGMHIYDRTNPDAPFYVSRFEHARACDPVFVQDDIAFVTLRNGSTCQSFTNQLDVVDISNISNPQLKKSYDMTNPHGLAAVEDNLYICDGDDGLKVFDKSDLNKIDNNRINHINNINAYDIIPLSKNHMIVVGDGGLYQYDSSDPSSLKEMSFVSIVKQ